MTLVDNGDGTARLAGTPPKAAAPAGGSRAYSFTLEAGNGIGLPVTQEFTLTVVNPGEHPIFTSPAATTFVAGTARSFTVESASEPAAAIAKISGSFPQGLEIVDNGDGTATISGTVPKSVVPPGGSSVFPIVLEADNGVGTPATQELELTVENPGVAPAFTSPPSTSFTTSSFGEFTIAAGGEPNASIVRIAGQLPDGVTLEDNGDGTATLAGTPPKSAAPADGSRAYSFTLEADNGIGSPVTQEFTLTVNNPGASPQFTGANTTSFTTGVESTFTVSTEGEPKPAITRLSGTLPTGVTLTDNGDGTAKLSGTPAKAAAPPGQSQAYAVTLKATNSIGSATREYTLTVSNPGVPAGFTSESSAEFVTEEHGEFTVSTEGEPKPAITRLSGTLPTGVTLVDNGDGTAKLAGTPAADDAPIGGSKTYEFTLEADNGIGSPASQPFVLTVVNGAALVEPTIVSPASATFTTGQASSFTVRTEGFPDPAVSSSGTLPSGLAFHDNGDGTATISGTPAQDAAPVGSSASYPLTIGARNLAGEADQTLTVKVVSSETLPPPLATAPSITSEDVQYGIVGQSLRIALGASGDPVPSLSLDGSAPAGLQLSAIGPGASTISGKPKKAGTSHLTLRATSSAGTATQQLAIVIEAKSRLRSSKVNLKAGHSSRKLVKILGGGRASCKGHLPSGARCRANAKGVLIESTKKLRKAGSYRLTVQISKRGGTTRHSLVVKVSRR